MNNVISIAARDTVEGKTYFSDSGEVKLKVKKIHHVGDSDVIGSVEVETSEGKVIFLSGASPLLDVKDGDINVIEKIKDEGGNVSEPEVKETKSKVIDFYLEALSNEGGSLTSELVNKIAADLVSKGFGIEEDTKKFKKYTRQRWYRFWKSKNA